ncbi:MAG: phosphate ABC transporter permease subunit PstC [Actinomycetota bacterium]|nr:phosphate ABC transporter permease subunit PstC [Actinomycetota bacterium]
MTQSTIESAQGSGVEGRTGRFGDRIFAGLSKGAGVLILVTLAGVALFLFREGYPGINVDPSEMDGSDTFIQYVGPLVFGTIFAALIALAIAAPLAIAVALFISHYAPRRVARTLGYLIDLLAAIPSVVFGIWGIRVLAPLLAQNVYPWLGDNASFIPLFSGSASTSGRTMLTAGMVLAVVILPIITAISREVFLQTPRLHEEASLALGATKWEMIRQAVIPYGRSGVISGAMLGLGRALGETMAVAIILSPSDGYFWSIITNQNSNTIASNIALKFPESSGLEVNRLIATGLVLFVITFGVNALARRVAAAGFSGADG